jgi:hypothetical protein
MFSALRSLVTNVFGDADRPECDRATRPTPFDIAAVLHLFSSPTSPLAGRLPLLPVETALEILDHAEYWQPLRTHQASPPSVQNKDALHALAPAFPAGSAPARQVRRVEFRTVSHDQGWSGDPGFHGTYEHSWTWFEAALLDDARQDAGARFEVVRNVHARTDWKEHRVVWGPEHPLVQQAQPGQHVGLYTCARFPGWTNHVRELEIAVYLAWP